MASSVRTGEATHTENFSSTEWNIARPSPPLAHKFFKRGRDEVVPSVLAAWPIIFMMSSFSISNDKMSTTQIRYLKKQYQKNFNKI